MQKMNNGVQNYAWGSTDALTHLYGIANPEGKPMAELWMGAHPKSSSYVKGSDGQEIALRSQISANLEQELGAKVAKASDEMLGTLIDTYA